MPRKFIFTEEQIEEIHQLVDEQPETTEEYIKKLDRYNEIVNKAVTNYINNKKDKNNE